MASTFAPEFLILIGVDVFLAGSILAVLLDKHFPNALPYVLDAGAIIGFGELLAGPSTTAALPPELQFWYSFAYAMISVLTLFALNLYLLFLKRRPYESALLGVFATAPSALGILYFTSAFVNGLSVSLPLVPVIPIEGVYAMFGISVAMIVLSLVVFGRRMSGDLDTSKSGYPQIQQPIITRVTGTDEAREMEAKKRVGSSESTPTLAGVDSVVPDASRLAESERGLSSAGDTSSDSGDKLGSGMGSSNLSASGGFDRSTGTVLEQKQKVDYAKRLRDSIAFFEKAVDHPVRIDPAVLRGVFNDVSRAYLTPAGMVMVVDSSGKSTSRSLLELSTDEALKVMSEAMKGLGIEGGSS